MTAIREIITFEVILHLKIKILKLHQKLVLDTRLVPEKLNHYFLIYKILITRLFPLQKFQGK